jgi:hypothetical protein
MPSGERRGWCRGENSASGKAVHSTTPNELEHAPPHAHDLSDLPLEPRAALELATVADRGGHFPREEYGPRLKVLLDRLSGQSELEQGEPERHDDDDGESPEHQLLAQPEPHTRDMYHIFAARYSRGPDGLDAAPARGIAPEWTKTFEPLWRRRDRVRR